MECNPPTKSGNVGCLGNLRWSAALSSSRVAAHILHQPGARLAGDLEDSPMADEKRECRRGRRRGRVGGTVRLASPACLFPLGVERQNPFISPHILVSVVTPREAAVDLSAADLQGIMSASLPGPKCLSGRLDNTPRSRCVGNHCSPVPDSNKTPPSLGSAWDLR